MAAWLRKHDPDDDYLVIPVIPDDGTAIHNESGFCYDTTHECHENPDSIRDLTDAIREGETTIEDVFRIFFGRTV